MKRILAVLATLALILPVQAKDNKDIIKTGWNFGPLPVVGFDSDLGFQYGVCCDIFNFGNGSNYPQYDYKINVEASTYTKGSSVLRTYGDFKTLIPDGKLFFDVTYFNAPKFGFYGYNGFASEYDPDRVQWFPGADKSDNSKSGFNFMSRNQFRALASVSKTISGNLSAAAGIAFYHITTKRLGLSDYDGQYTLYDQYVDADLIHENEKDGGNVTQLPVYSDRLTLAYRALVQANLWGDIPYYFTNNINSMFFRKLYTEGLGGNASVRGMNRNGVLSNGFAMFNIELRWRIYDFKFINQNWQIATNPFFDAGKTLQTYRLEEQKTAGLYSGDEYAPHYTAGLGIKLVMNHNMVVSFEAGKPFSKNDGTGLWTNVGFNYLF